MRATRSISGVIAPLLNVAITSALSEPTAQVNVNEGDHVHAGQVLAVLDTTDLQAQLDQAQATVVTDQRTAESDDAKVAQTRYTARLNIGQGGNSVQSARSAVTQAQQTLKNDQVNLTRDQQLFANGYVAQQALDSQRTTVLNDTASVRNANAQLQSAIINNSVNGNTSTGLQAADVQAAVADAQSARAVVVQAQASVRQYQAQIARATIVAPTDGVVVNRNLNPGEYPGSRTLFTLQRLDHVYAELNASSSDTFAIPQGAPVTLTIAGTSSETYRGSVVAVLGQVTPGSTNFTVKVLVGNADGKLQSGLPVTATATLPAVSGVGIPSTAFLDDTHTTVMAVQGRGKNASARTTHVRELGTDGTTSIVSGITAGEAVISNGQLGISDGPLAAE